MVNTVPSRDVLIAVLLTVNADSIRRVCGSVDVMVDGMVQTVAFYWSKIVMMVETMIKVKLFIM